MGHDNTVRWGALRAAVAALAALAALLLVFAATANAAPFHARNHSLDLEGLKHACGTAVDSKGDFYASNEGKEVKVYNPSHTLLTSIPDANEPCGLALTTSGSLYVSEQGTGEVVRFKPTTYPFVGIPTYEPREVIDASGNAKGIAVDRFDNRLYVAEGTKVAIYKADGTFEANVGEGTLSEASGVAAFTYTVSPGGVEKQERYLWVTDAAGADHLDLFRGEEPKVLKLRRELTGANTPEGSFGFGAAGTYLAEDPGNRGSKGECKAVGEQACTAGHLFLYDSAHKALDEFDASGVYLDQTHNAGFADAEPTQVAIDRSGGSGDGTIYVSAGAGAGSEALAFGPLKPPKRAVLGEPPTGLSQILEGARDVATDSHGDAYVVPETASTIHIYSPKGAPLTEIEDETEGEGNSPVKVAVDSTGKVYVLDVNGGFSEEAEVTYYQPSEYPPKATTTYTRHEPALVTYEDFPIVPPAKSHPNPSLIAVNPGPGPGKDHLLVKAASLIYEFDSAAEGSGVLNKELSKCVKAPSIQSIAVDGSSGTLYVGGNNNAEGGLVEEVNATGSECLARFANSGASNGKISGGVRVAVDQSNGHVIEYDQTHGAREYDAAGSFVAEFGSFTEGVPRAYGVAVDNACATHEPPLSGSACESFDPANGTAYVAFDDPNTKEHPPYDLNAFGLLKYPEPIKRKLTVVKEGSGSGKVTGPGIACPGDCEEEFLETEVVTLTAKADPENKFEGWVGCEAETVSPTEGTCEVTMDEAREVKAEFITEKTKKLLKVVIEGSGKVTGSGIDCPGDCEELIGEGNKITLSASAPPGSEFVEWKGGDCAGIKATTCTVTMDHDEEVTAEFGVEHPLLTVVKKGGGTGTVESEDGFIDCGSTCSHNYDLDDEVTLEAKANPGSIFEGWTGCDAEPSPTECEVTMDEPREVTATFITLPKAKVKPALLAYDEATLRGEVDPSGLKTKYRFKYLTQEEYEDNGETFEGAEPTEMEELAAGEGFVAVEAPLVGLEEGIEYRFRLGAENAAGSAPEDEGVFVTLTRRSPQSCANAAYRFGLSANLPDCRAYELVTPAQTSGIEPFAGAAGTSRSGVFSDWLTLQHGAGAGEDLAYFTGGTLPGFEGSGIEDGYRAQRGSGDHPAGGWQSAIFSPSYAEAAPGLNGSSFQLGVGADQLYSAWELNPQEENAGPQTLTKGAYLRTPGAANPKCNPQPLQSDFELIGCGSLGTDPEALSLYVSAEGAHVIFSSTEHLEKEAAPSETTAIYDRAAGSASAEVVSVKPNGTAFGGGEGASYAGASEDGSAVLFSAGGALYLHRAGQTTEIATSPNTFAGVSEEGTRVFYAATAKGEEAAPLFVCDTEAGSCAGSEKTHDPIEIAAAGIFTAVSSDGSHAFFSSTEVLTEEEANENCEEPIHKVNCEEAELGAHNLYAWDGADVRFLGRLVAADLKGGGGFAGEANMNLSNWTRAISRGAQSGRAYAPSRSTPTGEALVFQSHARLSAYDNEGEGEIYRYDPGAEEGERLTCVSCNPTGAPPSAAALLEDIRGFTNTPVKPTTMIANLTEDGQEVFFQSFDRLLPEDANEVEDVYEWKAKGAEGPGGDVCQRPGGCLSLISSGQGETPSILFAMSADGHDVFFQTKEKLVGEDVAGSPSIYDARLGGGIPEPSPPAPCQGDACQGQGSEPPALSNPATTGSGEAAEAPAPTPPRRCAKGKHRVKGRCVKRPGKRHNKKHHKANSKRGGKR